MEGKTNYYDYLIGNEIGGDPYQLIVSDATTEVTDELLFGLLFDLLFHRLPELVKSNWRLNTYGCLEHHYWSCQRARFAFVNFTKEQYEKRNGEVDPLIDQTVHEDIIRWISDHQKNSAIFEGRIRVKRVADTIDAERMNVPVGTTYTQVPEAKTELEAFQRLKFWAGPFMCEYLIKEFNKKYADPTAEIYGAELDELRYFLKKIDKHNLKDAMVRTDESEANEYLRIVNGFYNNHYCEHSQTGLAAKVYGKYILFADWLEKRLRESITAPPPSTLPALELGHVAETELLSGNTYRLIYSRTRLSDFFQVPAESIEGRFWYDIDDKDTADVNKVVRISEISVRQKARAEFKNFPYILEKISFIKDRTSKAFTYFLQDLIAYVKQMILLHQDLYKSDERDADYYELLGLADDFVIWLQNDHQSTILLTLNDSTENRNDEDKGTRQTIPVKAVALVHIYLEKEITNENASKIAYEAGHNSGKHLGNAYSHYSLREHRLQDEESQRKNSYKLQLFEIVIRALANNSKAQIQAMKEMELFRDRIK